MTTQQQDLEQRIREIENAIVRIETTIPTLASKEDQERLRAELMTELERLRGELERLRAEMFRMEARLIRWVVASAIASVAAMTAMTAIAATVLIFVLG